MKHLGRRYRYMGPILGGMELGANVAGYFDGFHVFFSPRRKFSERSPLRKSPKSQGKDRGPPKHHVFQVFFLELFGESISVVISGCVGYNDPLKTCQKLPSQKRWRVRVVSCWIRHFWIARFEGMKSRELDSCRLELQQLS